jgi:hypothetical protein
MVRWATPRVRRTLLHALVPILVVGAWAIAIQQIQLAKMTDVGLISVMPVSALCMLLILTVSFAVTLARRPFEPLVPLVHVVVLIVMLYAVTAFLEPLPRFSSVWRHVGIIDYISVHHSLNPHIDAYFSWPGFFALGAVITKAAGFHSALAFVAWGPLVFNLLFLPPLLAIFSWASGDARVRWLGLWVFYSCNWIGQDYVSPQAVGFLLWLTMLAALLKWFVPSTERLGAAPSLKAMPGFFAPGRLRAIPADGPPLAAAQSVGALLLVLVLYGATVAGHQLTPVPALLTVGAFAVFAGLQTRRLPVIMAVGLAAWISYMTTVWLAGHFATITGPLGSVGENVTQNIGGRLGGSAGHELVVRVRLLATAGIWALALAGAVRRLLSRRADVAMALVGIAPLLLPALQPYGGEIVLRVFLFSLPAAAFFIACLAYPTPQSGSRRLTIVLAAVVGCLLLGAFQLTRYGNERLDVFTRGDLAAVDALTRIAPKGSKLVAANGNLPWRYRGYADYEYLEMSEWYSWLAKRPEPALLLRALQGHLGPGGGYFIVTRSTEVSAELLERKAGVLSRFVRLLRTSGAARELYHSSEGDVFSIAGAG